MKEEETPEDLARVRATGGELAEALLNLEMEGLVRQLPGRKVCRKLKLSLSGRRGTIFSSAVSGT